MHGLFLYFLVLAVMAFAVSEAFLRPRKNSDGKIFRNILRFVFPPLAIHALFSSFQSLKTPGIKFMNIEIIGAKVHSFFTGRISLIFRSIISIPFRMLNEVDVLNIREALCVQAKNFMNTEKFFSFFSDFFIPHKKA